MAGTINGGGRLDAKLSSLDKILTEAKTVAAGFLEDATYPDGTPVALVAAVQNYGSPSQGIPPRPFFTEAVRKGSPEWPDKLLGILRENNYDIDKSMKLMGMFIVGQIQESIYATNSPPLAEDTVRRKGFKKPLIDTKYMWRSVDSEVLDK